MSVPHEVGSLPVDLAAPAKLTMSLRITGRRPDGYHLIDAEMVTVDLRDRLHLSPGSGLEVTGPFSSELQGQPARDNLVVRALALVGRSARARLAKHVPVGAGLGGGSADAAAVLRWAGASADTAVALGADVPFCLTSGRARVRGVGDRIEPRGHEPATFTVITPAVVVETGAVYRRWDELGGPTGGAGNDLEPAVVDLFPDMGRWRDRIADAAGERPRLAGSGSTWFLDGDQLEPLRPLVGDPAVRLLTTCRAIPAPGVEGRTGV